MSTIALIFIERCGLPGLYKKMIDKHIGHVYYFLLKVFLILLCLCFFKKLKVIKAKESPSLNLPQTIRVKISETGKIEVVDIKEYVKNVLPNEWYPSWNIEALKAGAIVIKTYAWYRVLNPKYPGEGYDVRDDTCDQVYKSGSAYPSTDAVIEETWEWIIMKDGDIFESSYDSGTPGSPNSIYQGRLSAHGTNYWAEKGKDWQWILRNYYDSITIEYTGYIGSYIDGWHDISHPQSSQPVMDCYLKYRDKLGAPFDNKGAVTNMCTFDGIYVHKVGKVWVQDFKQDISKPHYGTDGQTCLILNEKLKEAFLVKEGFWGKYKEKGVWGFENLGAPLNDEYENSQWCSNNGITTIQQDFENGYMLWDGKEVKVFPKNARHRERLKDTDSCNPISPVDYKIPEAPTKLTARQVSMNQVKLEWQSVQDVEKYIVYRNGKILGEASNSDFIDSNITQGIFNTYTVTSINGTLSSPPSNTATILMQVPPSAPTNLRMIHY